MVQFDNYEWTPQLLVNRDENSTTICNLDRIAYRLQRNVHWIRHYIALKLGVYSHEYDEEEDWHVFKKDLTDVQLNFALKQFRYDYVTCKHCGSDRTRPYINYKGRTSTYFCHACRQRSSTYIDSGLRVRLPLSSFGHVLPKPQRG